MNDMTRQEMSEFFRREIDALEEQLAGMRGTAHREDLNYATMLLREIRETAIGWRREIERLRRVLGEHADEKNYNQRITEYKTEGGHTRTDIHRTISIGPEIARAALGQQSQKQKER